MPSCSSGERSKRSSKRKASDTEKGSPSPRKAAKSLSASPLSKAADTTSLEHSPKLAATLPTQAEVYEIDAKIPKRELSWQRRQRDASFCQLCDTALSSRWHIESAHLSRKPFACSVCGYGGAQVAVVRVHAKSVHRGERAQILDYRSCLRQEYEDWHQRCFRLRTEMRKESAVVSKESSLLDVTSTREKKSSDKVNSPAIGKDCELGRDKASAKNDVTNTSPATPLPYNPDIFELSDTFEKFIPTWQMRQRDTSFCRLCNAGLRDSSRAQEHIHTMHSSRKPFACSICGYQVVERKLIRMHANRVHKGEYARLLDYRRTLQAEFVELHARCFAERQTVGGTGERKSTSLSISTENDSTKEGLTKGKPETARSKRLQPTWQMLQRDVSFCLLCAAQNGKTNARAHIYDKHMTESPFKCSVCKRGFAIRNSALTHLKNVHKREDGCVQDERAQLESTYEHWHERCFAPKN